MQAYGTHKQTHIVYTPLSFNRQSSSKLPQPLATQAHKHFYEESKPAKHWLGKKLKPTYTLIHTLLIQHNERQLLSFPKQEKERLNLMIQTHKNHQILKKKRLQRAQGLKCPHKHRKILNQIDITSK